jgi:ABC-2 type transport system ATP-binding protein
MRVREQLVYLARLRGTPKAVARTRATELLELLEVVGDPNDRMETLSLGNQQRVQLAAALVHEPDVLVLDEPFSGLDPVGVDVLADVLRGQARDRGVPVVFSSHQLELVERLCDEVVLIDRGRIVARGSINELRAMRARNLWRIEVPAATQGWWGVVPGVSLAGRDDGAVVLELSVEADPQRVLDLARAEGDVVSFGPVRPSLAELFREVVAE